MTKKIPRFTFGFLSSPICRFFRSKIFGTHLSLSGQPPRGQFLVIAHSRLAPRSDIKLLKSSK